MKILTKKSKTYPKDNIMSYGVTIIKKDTIKKVDDFYTYNAYYFNSLNEYNDWKVEEQNKIIGEKENEIQELKNKISELEVEPPLVDRTETNSNNIENHESLLNDLSQMIVEISTLQQI